MEVHPPHHPLHTWRDFFIHIATIVVGLLIAIGLEQSVEALHRRHLLHQAESKLHNELDDNERILASDRKNIPTLRAELEGDLDLIEAMDAHPPGSAGDLRFNWQWSGMSATAWDTARDAGAMALMPYELAQAHDDLYRQAMLVNEQAGLVFRDTYLSAGSARANRTLRDLTPAELGAVAAGLRQGLADLGYLDMLAANLDGMYRSSEGKL